MHSIPSICHGRSEFLSPKLNQNGTRPVVGSHQNAKGTALHGWLADGVERPNASHSPQQSTNLTDEEMARQLQDSYDREVRERESNDTVASKPETVKDKDEDFALQLQSSFDREHAVLSQVERYSGKRKGNARTKSRQRGNNKKRGKIDYFLKK